MTLNEIIIEARDLLGEMEGTEGYGSPFRWVKLCQRAADEIARASSCHYGSRNLTVMVSSVARSVVTGRARYCDPDLIRIEKVICPLADGSVRPLAVVTPQQMDKYVPFTWRTDAASGSPIYAITYGKDFIDLYPVPDYTTSPPNYLVISGVAAPGTSWSSLSAECPLPAITHEGVVLGAALRRIEQFPTPDNLTRRPMLQERLNYQKARISMETFHYTGATEGSYPWNEIGVPSGSGPAFLGYDPLS